MTTRWTSPGSELGSPAWPCRHPILRLGRPTWPVMKPLAIAILAGAASSATVAEAAPKDHLDEILTSRASLLAALGDPVAVGLILWDDPACTTRFGAPATVTGNDRGELATCLANL